MLTALLSLMLAGTQPLGCGSSVQRIELIPGVEVKLDIVRSAVEAQMPTMVYVDERGADFSLRLLDSSDQVLIRSDAAPSRAARERMLIPSGMQRAIIHFAIPASAKKTFAMVTVACSGISAVESRLFDGATALADSEELPEATQKLQARKRAIASFESVLSLAPMPTQRAQAMHNLGFLLRREVGFESLLRLNCYPLRCAFHISE